MPLTKNATYSFQQTKPLNRSFIYFFHPWNGFAQQLFATDEVNREIYASRWYFKIRSRRKRQCLSKASQVNAIIKKVFFNLQ